MRRAEPYVGASTAEVEAAVRRTLERHEQLMDRECVNLYAGTNVMNPRAAALLGASVATRPSLGYPGDKYEPAMRHAEELEIIAQQVITWLFGCRFAELRVPSGSLANLYAFMATTEPGDCVLSFPDQAAGHVTHHAAGAAGLYRLRVHDVPFDAQRMTIDIDRLRETARTLRPRLIVVGGSLCLFPFPVGDVRAIADEVGACVMYDAAHMSGLIAGGAFQQPLREGAHLMTSSTYKSFGGPAGGMVLTDDERLAERLDRIAYPGLTANFDLGRTAALIVAALDLVDHGRDYAAACIENARALAAALAQAGLPVCEVEGRGHTASQHVAMHAVRWGGGTRVARLLEAANILCSGIGLPAAPLPHDFNGVRFGTQEVTRWGLGAEAMERVADWIAAVLIEGVDAEVVRTQVVALRSRFQGLRFVRS